jgi:N-acylneuraminate cytidylyltransferase
MKALAIIPVRGADPETRQGHQRLLAGKPVLAHTIEAAKAARSIDRVLVTTDDAGVAALARELGADAAIIRPADLSADGVPLVRVLQHALHWLEAHEGYRPDLVVLLEITHPLRPSGLIDRAVDVVAHEGMDSAFVAREERHGFWFLNAHGQLERVHDGEEASRRQRRPLYKEMGGMVTVTRAELIRAGKRLGDKVGLVPVRDASSMVDLHDEGGFRVAQALLREAE